MPISLWDLQAMTQMSSGYMQVDVKPVPAGPRNPFGMAFKPVETLLTKESEAIRDCNAGAARSWKISNPSKKHPYTGMHKLPSTSCSIIDGACWL